MIRKILAASGVLVLAGFSVASADQLAEGDVEVQFRVTYNDLDFDGPGGSSDSKEMFFSAGYMLTDHHEIGAGVAYGSSGSFDALEFGVGYDYNFRTGENLNAFVGASVVGFGGDRGDLFDLGYGAEVGVKVYPWSHGGLLFVATYRELEGSGGVPDATQVLGFAGIGLKF
ncbi:MAG: porin family protein [Acidobacteriota bacterium]|nr:porin family protein [Acidobacteriota bacterium]